MATTSKAPRGRGRHFKQRKRNDSYDDKGNREDRAHGLKVDYSSPVIQEFLNHRQELDLRHDKHERIVKLSRDITIESKHIIFLLHRCLSEEKQQILSDAENKLKHLEETLFKDLAIELCGEDPYQYVKAYYSGIQEYIEAVTFCDYIKGQSLRTDWLQIEKRLTYKVDNSQGESVANEADVGNGNGTDSMAAPANSTAEPTKNTAAVSSTANPVELATDTPSAVEPTVAPAIGTASVSVHIPGSEHMLGVLDMSGELMRMCVSAIGAGDRRLPFALCQFVRGLCSQFERLDYSTPMFSRHARQKVSVLRQSLAKMERTCYTIVVRGEEIPADRLCDVAGQEGTSRIDYSNEDTAY